MPLYGSATTLRRSGAALPRSAADTAMLRRAALLIAWLAATSAAAAQEAGGPAVDFVLRGTAAAGGESDPSTESDAAPSLAEGITVERRDGDRPRPSAEDAVGEPLAGPDLAPLDADTERSRRAQEEADPYAAVGIRLGSFVLRPSIEIGVSATDDAGGRGRRAVGLVVAPQAVLESDWSRHAVRAEAAGSGIFYGDEALDETSAEARLSGRLDIGSRSAVEGALGYRFGRESYDDPDTPSAAAERPGVHSFDAELGARHGFGRLELSLKGRAELTRNEPVRLSDGSSASRRALDARRSELRLRAAYDLAAVDPFVEAAVGRRDPEVATDAAGYRRASRWGELRGGLMFDFGPKLSGEVAAGYRRERFAEPRFDDHGGLTAGARLMWSPRRLTEVTLALDTEARPSTLAGVSGSVAYSGRLAVERRVRRNLLLEAGLEAEHERFAGSGREDVTLAGFAGFTYDLNRSAAILGRYRYEQQDSSDPAADSRASTVSLRLRLKR